MCPQSLWIRNYSDVGGPITAIRAITEGNFSPRNQGEGKKLGKLFETGSWIDPGEKTKAIRKASRFEGHAVRRRSRTNAVDDPAKPGAQQIKVTDRPTRRAGQQPPSGGSGRLQGQDPAWHSRNSWLGVIG